MSYCACPECAKPMDPAKARRPDDGITARIESPIEQAFYAAFIGDSVPLVENGRATVGQFWIEPQVKVGPFRTDFVVGCWLGERSADVAVELDGHQFHAKTEEQVESDRRRDRAFVRMGAVVVRFTGREVTRDAKACVSEVQQLLTQWLRNPRRSA